MTRKLLLATALALGTATAAVAQSDHSGHGGDHAAHQPALDVGPPRLAEPGQGAFAALAEVVRVLEADPETDWSHVDLTALRAHLVDMDRVATDAVVSETTLDNGIEARATGDADTRAALRRMVPAHAAQLATDPRWSVTAVLHGDGVDLRVTSDDPKVVDRIKGLGFFGLMASQDHHRAHHLMIAQGKDAHAR